MKINGKVASVAVWPDAISTLIPKVDFLFIGRDELAPRSFFGSKRKDDILLPLEHFGPVLKPYLTSNYNLVAYELPAPIVPDTLRTYIRSLKTMGITGDGISPDNVLNQEIVAKFM